MAIEYHTVQQPTTLNKLLLLLFLFLPFFSWQNSEIPEQTSETPKGLTVLFKQD
jgi:hypothetical protein